MKLTARTLADAVEKPANKITAASLKDKGITQIDDMTECSQLRKLDLTGNQLSTVDSLKGLRDVATSLVYLNLSNNGMVDMDVVEDMPQINVLNVSNNKIDRILQSVNKLTQLRALILGHNQIKTIEHIDTLEQLNTLVVSHNQIKDIPKMPLLTEMAKISAAHNKISKIPDLSMYGKLKELRLNDNRITTIPEHFRECSSLRVIDLGSNKLDDWTSIAPLASLEKLDNLNLKGNPICSESDYRKRVVEMVPSLRILDGERFDAHFLKRREKLRRKREETPGSSTVVGKEQNGRKKKRQQ